ncbi:MAG TPA: lytic transglycosylase domain-containing protein [Thermoanaerobaculia bacterium]|nr:lytic transglycosylase domain-containing protein [Thermoanaerobaculia bacterium]
MSEIKTSRPFRERFLNGYDRFELPVAVEKVPPKRGRSIRRRTMTWALGAGLALGGSIAGPLAMRGPSRHPPHPLSSDAAASQQVAGDIQTAQQIASQVAGGVAGAVSTVATSAAEAPQAVAGAVAAAPQRIQQIAENLKANFFAKEVPFGSIIYHEAKKNNLPPELVAAVAHTESKFVPTARSDAGAVGLMQLVPRTGHWLGARDLTNPAQNIEAGAKYLRYLTDRFNGNEVKAIAAYNAGEGAVRRFGGIPPYRETRNYVQRVQNFQHDLGQRFGGQLAELQGTTPGL